MNDNIFIIMQNTVYINNLLGGIIFLNIFDQTNKTI